jgi:ectoine hydroxylase-related dioxygenase (phytanoyl-CoA dioxygenase family)
MWEFLGMNPADPQDWYRPPLTPGGMLEIYQHQALWNNRQYPRVYEAFAELLGTPKLWVSIDRVNFKPPAHPDHPEYDHKGFIHWDMDTSQLPLPSGIQAGVQGVLYLTDTSADQGGFQCVPGMHRGLNEWIETQPQDRNPFHPEISDRTVTAVPGKAGDLLIWSRLLPHGNGHNVSSQPRLAQFITMFPVPEGEKAQTLRQKRVRTWQERLAPEAQWVLGDPRQWEQHHSTTAQLTSLGRKLLGVDTWD